MMKKKWNSLTALKKYLEDNSTEEVKSFNGWELTTNKNVYRLAFGELSIEEK